MSPGIVPVSGQGLAQPAHDPRADKLRHAATEFESLLVKQLLKAAKIGGAGGEKANGYADMAVDALASSIESGGGLGLARRIEEAIGAGSHVGPGPGIPSGDERGG
jgi:Rod binding domain-containing protein